MNIAIKVIIQLMSVDFFKFHCKFSDRRGHTEDRCQQENNSRRAGQINQRNNQGYRSSANMVDVS